MNIAKQINVSSLILTQEFCNSNLCYCHMHLHLMHAHMCTHLPNIGDPISLGISNLDYESSRPYVVITRLKILG